MHLLIVFSVVYYIINKIREFLFFRFPKVKAYLKEHKLDKVIMFVLIAWLCWKIAKLLIHHFKL